MNTGIYRIFVQQVNMVLCIIKFVQLNTAVVFENVNSTLYMYLPRNHSFKITLVYGEKIIILLKKHLPLCEISQKDHCTMYKLNCKVQLLTNS